MTRLGYLVPEFPGQTHAFFWREIACLERSGCDVRLFSTRPPPASIVCHDWSRDAASRTTYLAPLTASSLVRAIVSFLGAGPRRWARCARLVAQADGLPARARLRALGLVLAGALLADRLRRARCTHVHVHSAADAALVALFSNALGGPPYSLTLHGHIDHYGPAQRLKWSNAAFGLTVTDTLRRQVLERVPSLPPEHLSIAPMGVDTDAFRRTVPYAPPKPGERWRLVSCGRLHPGKGHDDAIAALATLRDAGVDAELCILGEGPDRARLESLVASRGLNDRAFLPGAASEAVVRERLERAHAFVLASHDEALGVATMEAMAMELPVVVTRVGGVAELVRDGLDGLMVPAREPAALAAAIRRALETPSVAVHLGRTGSERVRTLFTSRRSADELLSRLRRREAPRPERSPS